MTNIYVEHYITVMYQFFSCLLKHHITLYVSDSPISHQHIFLYTYVCADLMNGVIFNEKIVHTVILNSYNPGK